MLSDLSTESPRTTLGLVASAWGVVGFLLILIYAIYRLAEISADALSQPLAASHWGLLIANLIFMAYYEGYKGFQKSYSPRLAARAKHLQTNATPLQFLLAPLFCMSFFHAPRRRIIASLLLTLMIVVFVLSFRLLPQPWRGILDAGVVVGLSWGLIATIANCYCAFTNSEWQVDPEVV